MIRPLSRLADPDDINEVTAGGPLPWLPGIPDRIAADPNWGPYLKPDPAWSLSSPTRSASTPQVKRQPGQPSARSRAGRADRRRTGVARRHPGRPRRPATHRATPARPRRPNLATATRQATRRRGYPYADRQWRRLLATEVPSATADPFLPELEERLSNLTRAGFDATLLVRSAAAAGPLPDDHPAAALWWRILDQLPQTPNQEPATPDAVPATRRTTTTSLDQQPPRPRSAPPPAFGPSR